ncbi:malectin domain-containing carbohydrate-binding protein [Puniceicoccaceae bacterium K14]|nr:malectin domain-containing carbohydrate-binding protein [Puniceicoccaceae bacterium K14]
MKPFASFSKTFTIGFLLLVSWSSTIVAQTVLIENGSFEDTVSQPATFQIIPSSEVSAWNSASGTIEIWISGFKNAPAVEGVQIAELDGSSLFQSFETVPGSTLLWSFYHRARETAAVENNSAILSIGALGDESFIGEFTSLAGEWAFHEGTYVVPDGQTETTIVFTATTTDTVSSLLDNVSIIELTEIDGLDSDGDGVLDTDDLFPNDPTESVDSDGDGVGDVSDPYPNDPTDNPFNTNFLVNGSFESTATVPAVWGFVPISDVGGWSSASSDIEIWTSGFEGVSAVDGNLVMELNGSTLQQPFATTPGMTLQWSFYHRGRTGASADNTMRLSLGSPGEEVLVGEFTSSTTEWSYYEGTYIVPEGQAQTSIVFAASTSATVSSLIDNIQIVDPSADGPGVPQDSMGPYLNGIFPDTIPGSSVSGGQFTTENAFPEFSFIEPVRIVEHPFKDEIVVVSKEGYFWRFDYTDPTINEKELILNLNSITNYPGTGEGGCTGFAFHPEFEDPDSPNRGYIYVAYRYHPTITGQTGSGTDGYNRISRFTIPDGQTEADLDSELVLIQQYDRQHWHIGGHMYFGSDGFLYIGLGDEGNSENKFYSTQRIDLGFWSGILRIDVDNDPAKSSPIARQPREPSDVGDTGDQRPSGWPESFSQGYSIPFDNPFYDADFDATTGEEADNLEEYYAIGLRHPWTFTQDPVTGNIYYGDVGQGNYEEVGVIYKGSNLQWGYGEGFDEDGGPINKPSSIIGTEQPPVLDYSHSNGRGSVISAGVYRGDLYPDLYGKHVFSDFLTGELWAIDADADGPFRLTGTEELPEGVELIGQVPGGFNSGIGSYTVLRDGRILATQSVNSGSIFELTVEGGITEEPPSLLSQTGAFSDLQNFIPSTDQIIPYAPNVPFWSDNAIKHRWIAIPNDGTFSDSSEQVIIQDDGLFEFPVGTVAIKHFQMALVEDDPTSAINIETRFFVRTPDGYYGVSYRWNEDGTDAELLRTGDERSLNITETSGGTREQVWDFPSRSDCRTCHADQTNGFLGANSHQLNGDLQYSNSSQIVNQLEYWNSLGIFSEPLDEEKIPTLLATTPIDDTSAPIQDRARSYIEVNCAYCHNPDVGVRANFDARLVTDLESSGLINGELAEPFGILGEAVIVPGDLERSIAYVRAHSVGESFSMPPLAKNLVDEEGITILAEWILSLSDSLGNDTSTGGNFQDGHHPSLYINTTDTYTNTDSGSLTISMNYFQFYANQLGNPVTPLIAVMHGAGDFTVLAIGETREAGEYVIGPNTFTFSATGSTFVTLQPGETLVTGFMDAFPDGTGWGSGSVIPASTTNGQAEDDIYGLLPAPLMSTSVPFNPDRDVPTIVEGETIAASNVGKSLNAYNLQRSYKYKISYTIGGAPEVDTDGDGVPDVDDAFPNDPTETTDTDGDGIGDNSDPNPDVPDVPVAGTELLINGSFENTAIVATTFVHLAPSQVEGWDSDGTELEFWADGFLGFDVVDGNQLAELNGISWAQAVATVPGTKLQWSFYHRGRDTTDTMTMSLGAPGAELTIDSFSTSPEAWVKYEGSYTVPDGQTVTTIVFTPQGTDNSSNLLDKVSLLVEDGDAGGDPELVLLVNAGGPAYTDIQGRDWQADVGFNTGGVFAVDSDIADTEDDTIYQSERYDFFGDPELEYTFGVENGEYLLNLHFAEIFEGTLFEGARVFGVEVEGVVVAEDVDIFAEVGGEAAYVISIPTTVVDGELNIVLIEGTENPKISGIELFATGPGDSVAPTDPAGLVVDDISFDFVTLSWNPSLDDVSEVSYSIYRDETLVGTTADTYFTDTGLLPETSYEYEVYASDASSNVSDAAILDVDTLELPVDTTAPSTPQGLMVDSVTHSTVELTWNASTDNTGIALYEIYRDGSLVGSVPGSETNFVDVDLVALTSYSYEVVAVDLAGNSSASSLAESVLTTSESVYLLNAGGGSYIDSLGRVWEADTGFNTGDTFEITGPISGTEDDTIYQSERYDFNGDPELEYAIDFDNGDYQVNLHFAEIYVGAMFEGGRVFNVQVEGVVVAENVDIYQEVGGDAAYVISIPTTVVDGELNIVLLEGIENPKISGIEVIPMGAGDTEAPTDPSDFVADTISFDSVALSWNASSDETSAVTYSVYRNEVLVGTTLDLSFTDIGLAPGTVYSYEIYASDVSGNVSGAATLEIETLELPNDTTAPSVPQNVVFAAVTQSTIELVWEASIDNTGISFYEIYRDGSPIATVPATETSFVDGGLITQTSYEYQVQAVDLADIASGLSAAISTTTLGEPIILVNAGGGAYTDSLGREWSGDFGFNTGASFEVANGIASTQDDFIYQSERFDFFDDPNLGYTFSVDNGDYLVNLYFAEVYVGTMFEGARVFSVSIEGDVVAENLDIFKEVGANTAYAITVPVSIVDGELNIEFIRGIENPKISGIEVIPQNELLPVFSSSSELSASILSSDSEDVGEVVLENRLVNLSTRAHVGTGSEVVIAGFVIDGEDTKQLLIRGIGPSLEDFNLSDALAKPVLTLLKNSEVVETSQGWSDLANQESILSVVQRLGAFHVDQNSNDTVIYATLEPGAYTVILNGANESAGTGLIEVYEASGSNARLINLSTRAFVGLNEKIAIPGVVIAGRQSSRLLVRAVGPSLAQFGLSSVLENPFLQIVDTNGDVIANNLRWGDNEDLQSLAATTEHVGAFLLEENGNDAAIIADLEPGAYTILVSSADGATGLALVEVYEVAPRE